MSTVTTTTIITTTTTPVATLRNTLVIGVVAVVRFPLFSWEGVSFIVVSGQGSVLRARLQKNATLAAKVYGTEVGVAHLLNRSSAHDPTLAVKSEQRVGKHTHTHTHVTADEQLYGGGECGEWCTS